MALVLGRKWSSFQINDEIFLPKQSSFIPTLHHHHHHPPVPPSFTLLLLHLPHPTYSIPSTHTSPCCPKASSLSTALLSLFTLTRLPPSHPHQLLTSLPPLFLTAPAYSSPPSLSPSPKGQWRNSGVSRASVFWEWKWTGCDVLCEWVGWIECQEGGNRFSSRFLFERKRFRNWNSRCRIFSLFVGEGRGTGKEGSVTFHRNVLYSVNQMWLKRWYQGGSFWQ